MISNQKRTRNAVKRIFFSLVILALFIVPASAGDLADSTLGTGLKQLLNDTSTYLMILCPIAGGAAGVYFAIRRSIADEQDGKFWEKRIKVAIGCGVGGCLVSAIISMLSSYF
jgi:Na+/H+ antiporter NhaA